MDGGAWWATVHGVVKSWTQLSHFTSLHFTSLHFTYTSLIHLEFILILWNENYLILEEIQRLVGLEIMYWKNLDNKIFAVFGK